MFNMRLFRCITLILLNLEASLRMFNTSLFRCLTLILLNLEASLRMFNLSLFRCITLILLNLEARLRMFNLRLFRCITLILLYLEASLRIVGPSRDIKRGQRSPTLGERGTERGPGGKGEEFRVPSPWAESPDGLMNMEIGHVVFPVTIWLGGIFFQIIKFYILFFQQFFLGKVLTYLMITKLYTIVSNFNFVITASSLQILCSLDISNSDSLMKQASFVRNDNGVQHVQHHAHWKLRLIWSTVPAYRQVDQGVQNT